MAQTQKELLEAKEKALDARENSLKAREREVSNLEATKKLLEESFNSRSKLLDEQEKQILTDKTKELSDKTKELEELSAELAKIKKEKILVEGELTTKKSTTEAQILAYRDKRVQEVESVMTKRLEAGLEKIEKDYQAFLNSSISTVNWSNEQLKKAFDGLNNEFKELLKSQENIIEQRRKDLEEAIKTYNDASAQLESLEEEKSKLKIVERKLNVKEKNQERFIQKAIEEKYSELVDENTKLQTSLDTYKQKAIDLSKEMENIKAKYSSNEFLDKIHLQSERDRLLNELDKYQQLYKDYTSEEYQELKLKVAKLNALEEQNRTLRNEKIDLTEQVEKLKSEALNNDSLKFKNDALENQIRVERQMLSQLQTEINNLSSRIENKKSGIVASESIQSPVSEFINLIKDDKTNIKEIKWLENIITKCEEAGFKFSKRLYYSFHTSLKTSDMSPLTVLAGVSGTGKSKLPQLYSKFGGIYFLSEPVKPDWDSPQSLFGYYNSIEKRFDATTLLRALVMFQANKSKSQTKQNITDLSDRVLIVLLDEMNLAHIEQYFSDLLSKLEERRGNNSDVSFEVDLGAGNDKYSIVLTDNVKWVGTMNEDETTKSLSDKVIDRGNIISFPRPTKFERYNKNKNAVIQEKMLLRSVWENWSNTKIDLTDEEYNKYSHIVMEINESLKVVNRALGHRVWQSIENYMISHPLVLEYEKDKTNREIALNYAFEEALVHKVMPKLRGINTDGTEKEECLDKIEKILSDNSLEILNDFDHAMKSVTGTFIWDSALYLDDEYKNIK